MKEFFTTSSNPVGHGFNAADAYRLVQCVAGETIEPCHAGKDKEEAKP